MSSRAAGSGRNWLIILLIVATTVLSFAVRAGEPTPLTKPRELIVGYQKVGHLAPIVHMKDELAKLGITLVLKEYPRYADARAALVAGKLDLATAGPADLATGLANGERSLVALLGTGAARGHVVVRKDVKLDGWSDLKGKRVGVTPGSISWVRFVAAMVENGVSYGSIEPVTIDGAMKEFDTAIEQGRVDAVVAWQPVEALIVASGHGRLAEGLEYSRSTSVGDSLGVVLATQASLQAKRNAIKRFVWGYVRCMEALQSDPEKFAGAFARLADVDRAVARRIVTSIRLDPALSVEQMQRQSRALYDLKLLSADVAKTIPQHVDTTFVSWAQGG